MRVIVGFALAHYGGGILCDKNQYNRTTRSITSVTELCCGSMVILGLNFIFFCFWVRPVFGYGNAV